MKFLKITLILLALSAFSILPLGCGSNTSSTSAEQVVTVQRGNVITQITGVGNLAFSQTKDLTFGIAGNVSEVLVKAGDSVKQGQVLCRLDASTWQGEINTLASQATAALRNLSAKQRGVIQSQQNLALAQQGLQTANNTVLAKQIALLQALINLQNAELALEQASGSTTDPIQIQIKQLQVQLARQQAATAQIDLDNTINFGIQNAQAAIDDATAALDDAKAAVLDAQTALNDANQTLTDAQNTGPEVKSPLNGLITNVNVTSGQNVNKGTVAVTIADATKFEASLMVSELNILKVKLGGSASVQVEVLNGVSIPATVSFIAPSATIQSSVVNYEVKVQLATLSSVTSNQTSVSNNATSGNNSSGRPFGGSGQFGSGNLTQEQRTQIQQSLQARQSASSTANVQLFQGMTVTVNIITAEADNVLMVPTEAIISQGGNTTVQVLVNGVAESHVVQTGISNSQYTEIISGLNEGDQVLITQTSSTSSSSGTQTQRPQTGGGGLIFGR